MSDNLRSCFYVTTHGPLGTNFPSTFLNLFYEVLKKTGFFQDEQILRIKIEGQKLQGQRLAD